jgi:hypothetical protein
LDNADSSSPISPAQNRHTDNTVADPHTITVYHNIGIATALGKPLPRRLAHGHAFRMPLLPNKGGTKLARCCHHSGGVNKNVD